MREDDTSQFKGLSGVGVAFKLVMALRYRLNENGAFKGQIPNIKKYLNCDAGYCCRCCAAGGREQNNR